MKLGHRGRTGRLLVARIGTKYLVSSMFTPNLEHVAFICHSKQKIYDCMTLFLKWSDIGNLISTRVEDVRVSKMCLLGTGHGRPRIHASLRVHPTTMKELYWWIRGLLCSTIINVITTLYSYMNIKYIIHWSLLLFFILNENYKYYMLLLFICIIRM